MTVNYIYFDWRLNKLEPIYVGYGSKAERPYKHLTVCENDHLKKKIQAIRDTGIEPSVYIQSAPSELAGYAIERFLIAVMGRYDLKKGPLCNKTDGGEGGTGYIHSQATRDKRSAKLKGRPSPMRGRKQSREAIEATRRANIGRVPTDEARKKMSLHASNTASGGRRKGVPKSESWHQKIRENRERRLAEKKRTGDLI